MIIIGIIFIFILFLFFAEIIIYPIGDVFFIQSLIINYRTIRNVKKIIPKYWYVTKDCYSITHIGQISNIGKGDYCILINIKNDLLSTYLSTYIFVNKYGTIDQKSFTLINEIHIKESNKEAQGKIKAYNRNNILAKLGI